VLGKYAIFDIAESRFFLAQNAPKSFVARLVRTRWGAYSAPPDPLAAFDCSTSKRGVLCGGEGRKGEGRCYAPPPHTENP